MAEDLWIDNPNILLSTKIIPNKKLSRTETINTYTRLFFAVLLIYIILTQSVLLAVLLIMIVAVMLMRIERFDQPTESDQPTGSEPTGSICNVEPRHSTNMMETLNMVDTFENSYIRKMKELHESVVIPDRIEGRDEYQQFLNKDVGHCKINQMECRTHKSLPYESLRQ